ncbi:hypothetical protein [Haloactinospora alba]|uniref:hypothetical protein n=1 Tax=Haloactinospora alba TaxID=405555 RepID=UPI00147764B4|nr:hypothetical protein [Haloactinospora alba]
MAHYVGMGAESETCRVSEKKGIGFSPSGGVRIHARKKTSNFYCLLWRIFGIIWFLFLFLFAGAAVVEMKANM